MNSASIAIICTVIGVACTVIGTILGYITFRANSKKDTKADTKAQVKEEKEAAADKTKLGIDMEYIKRGVDDIRLDIKSQDRKISNINDRLIRVEESTKSAHHRLDGIEKEE